MLSLAIGIGANCAIFSFADALLLRPLPVARPGETVPFCSLTGTAPAASRDVSRPIRSPSRHWPLLEIHQSGCADYLCVTKVRRLRKCFGRHTDVTV
jgi:hypothetical protein